MQRLLQGWGCTVSAAADGDAAQRAHADRPADVWLFDYHLDNADTGVALCDRLVRAQGVRPTVILSADAGETVRRAVHEAGLPLLIKPLKPLALKSVLDRLLAARGVQ
jgi:CheY-like chemotaxis protein